MPSGVGKLGSCGLPSTSVRLQRLAISTELASALGTSAKSAAISAADLKYCSRVNLRTPARIAQDLALGNAHARLVGLEVFGGRELHRMGRDHRQAEPGRQLHRGHHVRLVLGPAGALQLDVEAMREQRRQLQRDLGRALGLALQQRRAQRTGLRAGEQDQSALQLLQPGQLAGRLRLAAADVLGPGPGQKLRQVQVAFLVLHQQQHAGQRARLAAEAFEEDLRAEQRLDALGARFLVELDAAEQVVQVGDRQRRLAVGGRSLDDFVDAIGAVDDGKLGVQAQVDEHPDIVENGGSTMWWGRPYNRAP